MTAIDTSTEAVERLLDGVTPGPWSEHDAGKHPYVFVCGPDQLYYDGEVTDKPLVAYVTGVGAIENRAFITAARDLIPALLKERDEARARVRALEDALRGMMDREARIALQTNGHKPLWEASPEWIAAWNALATNQERDALAKVRAEAMREAVAWFKPIEDAVGDAGLQERREGLRDAARAILARANQIEKGETE